MKSKKMLIKSGERIKCDVKDCKNDAQNYFAAKGLRGKFFICADCLNKLVNDAQTERVPKSPQNTIKRKIEVKQKEDNR